MPVRKTFSAGEFCWLDLASHDMDSAVAWYSDVFGWIHMVVPSPEGAPPYAFLMQDLPDGSQAAVAGVGQMSDEMKAQGIPPVWNTYIYTDDCVATEARVQELGGKVTVPTSEIPGMGKLAFFMDPEGASFATWQSLNAEGPGLLVKEPVSLSWNELMTRDQPMAKEFYGELFGWGNRPMPMGDVDYSIILHGDQDGGGMMTMDGPQFENVPAHWLVYFEVTDCAEVAKKVESAGGKVMVPATEIPVGTFAVLSDPQGGAFAVVTVTAQNA